MIEKESFFPIGIGTYKPNLEEKEKTLKRIVIFSRKGQKFYEYSTCL